MIVCLRFSIVECVMGMAKALWDKLGTLYQSVSSE